MPLNKKEIEWIYSKLANSKGLYMLEEIIDIAKDYSVREYHEYCNANSQCKTIYEKTKDLLHIRIMAAKEVPDAIKWRLLAALYPENYVVKKGVGEEAGHDEFVLEM